MAGYKVQLGVIGGSGVYKMDGVEIVKRHDIDTPFGKPSDQIIEGRIAGKTVYFLPRHGVGHVHLPSEVNYRANIYAMKTLGVTHLLAVSAVGIMKKEIHPGDMVIPDQLYDRTKGIRPSTFFGNGIVGHVAFADPFSAEMSDFIYKAASACTKKLHRGGAYVCMEGPQFSTRAESHAYRENLRPAIIGMTAIPEAKLAREAEMAYGMLALATDYDCWNEEEEDVSVTAVMEVMKANSETANNTIKELARILPDMSQDPCLDAAKYAIMTDRTKIPAECKRKLQPILGRYLG